MGEKKQKQPQPQSYLFLKHIIIYYLCNDGMLQTDSLYTHCEQALQLIQLL